MLLPNGYSVTTPPAAEPVSIAELAQWLRLDTDEQYGLLDTLIESARRMVEAATGRALITQTRTAQYPSWPRGLSSMWLPGAPLATVTSVKYYDEDGVQQTLAASNYVVDIVQEPGRITAAPDISFPSLQLDRANPITVLYVCGYGDDGASIPATARSLVLTVAADYFEHPALMNERQLTQNPVYDFALASISLPWVV